MNKNMVFELVGNLVGSSNKIVIDKILIDFMYGSHAAAAFLSQLAYWSTRTKIPDGWVAKSAKDWYDEIRVRKRTIKKATDFLVEKGVLETENRKFNGSPTIHFKLNQKRLVEALFSAIAANGAVLHKTSKGNEQMCKTVLNKCAKPLTEITNTENTYKEEEDMSFENPNDQLDKSSEMDQKKKADKEGLELLSFLGKKRMSKFRKPEIHLHFVTKLLKKYHPNEVRAVIAVKCDEWLYTPQAQYLRPSTLFQATTRKDNFSNYLDEAVAKGWISYPEEGDPEFHDLSPEYANRNTEYQNVFSPLDEPYNEVVSVLLSKKKMSVLYNLRRSPITNQEWKMLRAGNSDFLRKVLLNIASNPNRKIDDLHHYLTEQVDMKKRLFERTLKAMEA